MTSIDISFLGVYLFLAKNKIRVIKRLLIIVMVFIIMYPLFDSLIENAFTARAESAFIGSGEYEEESRYLEFQRVYNDWRKRGVGGKLIGNGELFNDIEYFNVRRMLHTDYMTMLSGAGIVGLVIYLLIPLYIIKDSHKIKTRALRNNFFIGNDLFATVVSLALASYAFGMAGSIMAIDVRALFFLYTGAIIGLMKNSAIIINDSLKFQGSKIIS